MKVWKITSGWSEELVGAPTLRLAIEKYARHVQKEVRKSPIQLAKANATIQRAECLGRLIK